MEGKKLRIDSRGEIILLRRRSPGVSKSGYRALDVKIGMLVMWCCILFISAIVFFPPAVVSGRVLRYLSSGARGRGRGRVEVGESTELGKISLTEWPSLRELQGRDSAASFLPTATVEATGTTSTSSSTATATPMGPLRVFQVAPPVQGPGGVIVQSDGSDNSTALSTGTCQVTLMVHVFKDSFGAPFVGNYTPPSCMGSANAVVMNFEVQSQGTQFDRLGIM